MKRVKTPQIKTRPMTDRGKPIQEYYDVFWPEHVQHYTETRKYMLQTISGSSYRRALDAGCGPGICSIVLAELAQSVLATDISSKSVDTARKQAAALGHPKIEFTVGDLQELDARNDEFDLVWCWGVAMMAPDPMKVIRHLFRVTEPGGELYLGLYLKTWLSPVHQLIRHFCRAFMATPRRKKWVLDGFAALTRAIVFLRGAEINVRADNVSIQAQVDDWYYPPYKTFYSIEEILRLFRENGFDAECIQDRIGRMRSATIFVIKGTKR
jgi:2-polyprenyl-6-hydroxyphenyl methylase / 3-demethylubiquinone-9 3-methyltransferase